jgi:hypothetical protein
VKPYHRRQDDQENHRRAEENGELDCGVKIFSLGADEFFNAWDLHLFLFEPWNGQPFFF